MKLLTCFDLLLQGIDANIRHEAIQVPSGSCPFNQEGLILFENGLNLLKESGDLPPGYGVTLDELDGNEFDEEEEIQVGLNRNGHLMALPHQIWKPRTELWVQGLFVMTSTLLVSN
jgi:hypothetical protein